MEEKKKNTIELNHKSPLIQKNAHKYVKMYSQDEPGSKGSEVRTKLANRQTFSDRKRRVNDAVTILALLGIILVVVATEFNLENVTTRDGAVQLSLMSSITLSTVILEVLLIWYHYLDLRLYMNIHHLDDWRMAMDTKWAFQIFVELIVCAVHPFPGLQGINLNSTTYARDHNGVPHIRPIVDFLTIAMFLRLYLLCRVSVLHSAYGRDLAVQSLTTYNHIKINFWFVFKSMLTSHPGVTLTGIVVIGVLLASWFLRICEAGTPKEHGDFTFSNCVWMICITFLTIGYGDLTPSTPSGRAIAVLLGIFGVGCTALLIGLVAQKLELSRNEKFLHNFVADTSLRKQLRQVASNIIKYTWFIHSDRRKGREAKELYHRKKLQRAQETWRELKRELQDISDDTASIEAIYKEQMSNSKQMLEIRKTKEQDLEEMKALKMEVTNLNEKLTEMHTLLANIAGKRA